MNKPFKYKLLPERLAHYEDYIPRLKEEQERLRRHRGVGSLDGVGLNVIYPLSPKSSESFFYIESPKSEKPDLIPLS